MVSSSAEMPRPSSAAAATKPSNCRERVQVVVRCRPMLHKELMEGRQNCVSVDTKERTIEVRGVGRKNGSSDNGIKAFTYDRVYDSESNQQQIYREVAHPIVQSVMHGYNGTILAYGQTASGKTYTMEGFEDLQETRGIVPNAFEDIFSYIMQSQSSEHFLVSVSYLEIYNEEIRDLLATVASPNTKLELKENPDAGVYVKNLTCLTVHSLSDIIRLLTVGKKNRSVGATLMNQDSSRSHSIFTITVEASVETGGNPDDGLHVRVGKLNLVDLAGSERMSKTGATGDRFKEMTNINWSLTALGNVISALVDGKSTHIPYRDSKLTRLLQDSLGGNTRTVMVANIGPADYNYEESVSTLRYANRAKNIRNKPRINEDPKDAMLREFQSEIMRLKAQLKVGGPTYEDLAKEVNVLKSEKEAVEKHLKQAKEQTDKHRKGLEASFCQSFSEQAIAYIKADLEKKAHLEIEYLRAEKERSEEEKEKLTEQLLEQLKEMHIYYETMAREREDHEVLAKQLKALEDKLLHGSKNDSDELIDKSRQQEQELALYEQQLQERQYLDEERQQKIAELEEAQLIAEVKCNTMEEELEMKTHKLRKLVICFKQNKSDLASLQTELQDTIHEFHRERADLLLNLRTLNQQHQLKSLIIENFIPAEEVSKIMKRIQWDDDREEWVLQSMISHYRNPYIIDPINKQPLQRPSSAVGRTRPTCQRALEENQDPRYLAENVLKLELEMPTQNLYDYDNHLHRAQAQTDVVQAFSGFFFNNEDGPYLSYESNANNNNSWQSGGVCNVHGRPPKQQQQQQQQQHSLRPKTANR